jgi:hypothetical protein
VKFRDIQKTAKALGVNPFGMNRVKLIRSIQRAENNFECFGTPRVIDCGETGCAWRTECLDNQTGNQTVSKHARS